MKKYLALIMLLALSVGWWSVSAQTQIAVLVKVGQPGLDILRSGTQDWVAVTMESVVGSGDRLRTNGNGQAEITLFDGSALIALKPNTELSINRMERTEQGYLISFGLLNGHIHQTLIPVPETYVGYEFSTPTTTVVTAGGVFDLWLDANQNTSVLAADGAVYVGAQRTQLVANEGIRASADGAQSEIIAARTAAQLSASIDGVPARFVTDADVQLNIRQGPNARTELLGTILPSEVTRVMGVSEDGRWYRVRNGRGHGWVSRSAFEVELDAQNLVAYPADHIERQVVAEAAPTNSPATAQTVANTAQMGSAVMQTFSRDEIEVIALINEWRIGVGLWPLKPNSILRDMAYAQGRYLLTLAQLPDDLHIDSKGRNPRERALDPAFKWPHYLGSDRMAIGENIYIGNNVRGAINYWQNSPIHRQATESNGYREVGVAVLPHPLGHIYVVVFGSRPNVLPILLDPTSGTLYVSSEAYRFASPGDWVSSVSSLQFIPNVLSPVDNSAWLPWARSTSRPPMEAFTVAYQGDANKLVMVNFDPASDVAWLPANLPNAAGEVAVSANAQAAPAPTATPALLAIPQMSTTRTGGEAAQPAFPTAQPTSASLFATRTPTAP
jgi:uncharacterized protein YkwD